MVSADDVFRVVAEWDTALGTIAQLVYHYVVTTGGADTDQQIIDEVQDQLELAWLEVDQNIADEVSGSTISLLKWDFVNHRWDGILDQALTTADGLSAAQMISHGAAGLVKIFTESARRQARKYMFGLTEDGLLDGSVVAAVVTSIALFATVLDNPITPAAAVLKYCTFNTDETSPLYETASPASQTVTAEAVPAYQRRRRPGTGI